MNKQLHEVDAHITRLDRPCWLAQRRTGATSQEKKEGKLPVGTDNVLFRFEWIEALTRIAVAKYGRAAAGLPPDQAVERLIEHNLMPRMAVGARTELNAFRTHRLYNEDVDALLQRHEGLLQALYSRWRLRPADGGLRTKVQHAHAARHYGRCETHWSGEAKTGRHGGWGGGSSRHLKCLGRPFEGLTAAVR